MMNVNILLLEEIIDKTVKKLIELKKRKDIEKIEIKIHKYWMDDYYDTNFTVDYNVGEVN